MAQQSTIGGSPFLQEVWRDSFGLGGSEFGICLTLNREGVPWSTAFDANSLDIVAEILTDFPKSDRRELAKLLRVASESLRLIAKENKSVSAVNPPQGQRCS